MKDYCEFWMRTGRGESWSDSANLDQVMIGDVERTRIKNIKALFFVGAIIHFYREIQGVGGLLSECDREQFQKKEISLSPGAKEKIYIQKFYLYLNLTKPTKFLFLSWAKVSGEGKISPAVVSDSRSSCVVPDLKPVDEEEKSWQQCEMTRRTGILRLAEGLREEKEQGLDAQWKELYTWFAGDEKSRSVVRKAAEKQDFIKKKPVCWEVRWLKSCILILNA